MADNSPNILIYPEEARNVAEYLIGDPPSKEEAALYRQAVESLGASLDPKQERIWLGMLGSRFEMSVVDAGLALTDPSNNIRKRIFIMLAILEASPRHTDKFLPEPLTRERFAKVTVRMIISAFRSVIGLLFVLFNRM